MIRGVAVSAFSQGLIAVWAQLRNQIPGNEVVVTVSRDQSLLMYPLGEWDSFEKKLMKLPSTDYRSRSLQRLMIGHASNCSLDRRGRVRLPPQLKEFAQLEVSAVFVGSVDKIEVWNEARWQERLHTRDELIVGQSPRHEDLNLALYLTHPSPSGLAEGDLNTRVVTIPASAQLLSLLKADPTHLRLLGPEDLEIFVGERFEKMGFRCQRIGNTRQADGGIDMVGFTDHEHLDDLALIHMNGRVFDPLVSRFLSADPNVQSPYNQQSYNRYSYVSNNPLNARDPTGYFSWFDGAAVVVGAVYAGPFGALGAYKLEKATAQYLASHQWAYAIAQVAVAATTAEYCGGCGSAALSADVTYAKTGSIGQHSKRALLRTRLRQRPII